ncbi:uracil phosphoribosyltransferase [Alistipes sp. ZOR0009]|jgi:uracil phosphoribosyltransferase|uniref:uracil phosphoribosyltransferase n=1 Tax=Alistipes sp. ZOR0009 TaxID=1339253 RepID=UPI000645B8A4|nr:uracil phosphoribosyltransferase [Alistipes sp. ZOR0009]
MVINLAEQSSLLNQFIAELRDVNIQNDSLRFRRNLERIGEIFAYEISKTMPSIETEVQTPLGVAQVTVPSSPPVIASILRAGLPLHQGLLNFFDKADSAFISASRAYNEDGSFRIQFDNLSCPVIDNKDLILVDPMLATGASMVLAIKALLERGTPSHVHIVSVIASQEGIDYTVANTNFENVTFWSGAIDPVLTPKKYISPGLGDAGDLAYGKKLK